MDGWGKGGGPPPAKKPRWASWEDSNWDNGGKPSTPSGDGATWEEKLAAFRQKHAGKPREAWRDWEWPEGKDWQGNPIPGWDESSAVSSGPKPPGMQKGTKGGSAGPLAIKGCGKDWSGLAGAQDWGGMGGEPPAAALDRFAKAKAASAALAFSKVDVQGMDPEMVKVLDFLSRYGLIHYANAFKDSGFDTLSSVQLMTEQDMREECNMTREDCEVLTKAIAMEAAGGGKGGSEAASGGGGAEGGGVLMRSLMQGGGGAQPGSMAHMLMQQAMGGPAAAQQQGSQEQTSTEQPGDFGALAQMDAAGFEAFAWRRQGMQGAMQGDMTGGMGGVAGMMEGFGGDPAAAAAAMSAAAGSGAGFDPMMASSGIDPNNGATTLYALAQLAEESAQYATAAAAFCAVPRDLDQVTEVANAAEQAGKRAAWAAKVVSSYEPQGGGKMTEDGDSWLTTIKGIVSQAAEAAEQAVSNCRENVNIQRRRLPYEHPPNPGERRCRVPCRRFFESGNCNKGEECPFSHDARDRAPRLLKHKKPLICTFFEQNKCIRGSGCTFAHGQEELATIIAVKDEEEQRKQHRLAVRNDVQMRPGDWECPGCGDLQFARNAHCRRCGASREREPRPPKKRDKD